MTFIVFPEGEYEIGWVKDEPGRPNEEIQLAVKITRPFALLDREVTFAELIAFDPQYSGIMRLYNAKPEVAGFGPMWYDAVQFCHWLSEQSVCPEEDQSYPAAESLDKDSYPRESNKDAKWAPLNWPIRLDGRGFRLPTEAEWEVVCRAGTRTMYGQGGDDGLLGRYAWNGDNSGTHAHVPKTRRPGLRGVSEMHGNLVEWCHDWYGYYPLKNVDDWTGPDEGSSRVLRGGSWNDDAVSCRSSSRDSVVPAYRNRDLGFRLALVPSIQDAERQALRAEAIDPSRAEPDGS